MTTPTRRRPFLSLLLTSLVAITMLVALTPAASAQHPALGPVREVVDPVANDATAIVNEAAWQPAYENVSAVFHEHAPESFECHQPSIPNKSILTGGSLPVEMCIGTKYADCNVMIKLMYYICL